VHFIPLQGLVFGEEAVTRAVDEAKHAFDARRTEQRGYHRQASEVGL